MKVKNVIRGLLKEYELEEISIITENRVAFSGAPGQWAAATSAYLILYKRKIENSEVIKKMIFNNRKAFIFINDREGDGE